jgi:acetyl esterase
MPLHPQVKQLLFLVETSGEPPLNELSPPEAREAANKLRVLVGQGPELPQVEDFQLPTRAGEITARRYVPEDPQATILWLHGGGWVIGDLESHDAMCRLLAQSSGCRVVAVDYRLAPEHPFPAPLEDCWDALTYLAALDGDQPLILGGDSAGGNMTAVCTHRARDRGGPELALQILVYPATSQDDTTESYRLYGSGPETFLTSAEMEWFHNHYLPNPADRMTAEVAPLLAESLENLPPAIVITAEYDPLRDDGLAYVERLRAAGVPVSHHHYDDVVHAFFSLINLIQRGNEAVEQVGAEVRAALERSGALRPLGVEQLDEPAARLP